MKAASTASGQPMVGMRHVALPWCLCILWCAPVAGSFLLQRQVPAAAPAAASVEAAQHINLNMQKLREAADIAVADQGALITAVAQRKEGEARTAIEKEIPLAAAADTQELAKDVAAQDMEVNAAMQKSTEKAQAALGKLKEKAATAITMSAKRSVRDVEKEAESDVMNITEHSVQLELEAEALANEATGAANYSQEAADNTNIWVKELPVEEAADTVAVAKQSIAESMNIRKKYEYVKRIAKLAGNMALHTIELSEEAEKQAEKAKKDATLTAEQAAQNALLLKTIRVQTKKASDTAVSVVDRLNDQR